MRLRVHLSGNFFEVFEREPFAGSREKRKHLRRGLYSQETLEPVSEIIKKLTLRKFYTFGL